MRSHHDKITFFFFCQLDDCIGRMLIPDVADLTVDADALSALLVRMLATLPVADFS
jgi:hypothetical protein